LKPTLLNEPDIAAVNRCATQNQTTLVLVGFVGRCGRVKNKTKNKGKGSGRGRPLYMKRQKPERVGFVESHLSKGAKGGARGQEFLLSLWFIKTLRVSPYFSKTWRFGTF
jgi:hypothetical protein